MARRQTSSSPSRSLEALGTAMRERQVDVVLKSAESALPAVRDIRITNGNGNGRAHAKLSYPNGSEGQGMVSGEVHSDEAARTRPDPDDAAQA